MKQKAIYHKITYGFAFITYYFNSLISTTPRWFNIANNSVWFEFSVASNNIIISLYLNVSWLTSNISVLCNEIIPIEAAVKAPKSSDIKITLGDIVVTMPSDSSAETIKAVLTGLKLC